MKEHEVRLTATGIIWLAFTIVMVSALIFSYNLSSAMVFTMAVLFTVAALVGTNIVWKRPSDPVSQIERSEKAKRRSRVDDMLDAMNDDELDELRNRLAADYDGEAVSINELLTERERRHR